MGSVRMGRVNDELMKTLSELIRTVRDPRVSGLVSIVRVECAPDLGSAKVYVSALGDEDKRRECIKGLRAASGYLRREAARAMGLRHTPELTFINDDSIVSGTHIMELIETVSRRDREKKKLTPETAAEFLRTRDDILILTHKSPDGDTVGSAAALCFALNSIGKRAYVFENPDLSEKLRRRIKPYFATEGFSPSCIVAVDIADIKLLPSSCEEFADRIELAIDHHVTHSSFAGKECVIPEAAACGEIIFDIIKALGAKITKKLADSLYLAISTDTGRFLHGNTTPESHKAAAELIALGADFTGINREFFVEKSPSRISLEAEILSGLKLYFDGRVSVIKMTEEMVARHGATNDDTDSISALARVAKGVELGIYLHERDGAIKLSLRSDGKISCAEICALFGGGGHDGAAGCTMDCDINDAEERIIAKLNELDLF